MCTFVKVTMDTGAVVYKKMEPVDELIIDGECTRVVTYEKTEDVKNTDGVILEVRSVPADEYRVKETPEQIMALIQSQRSCV